MVSFKKNFCAGLALAVFAAITAADQRSYVWTYEYQTLKRGVTELEYYLTFDAPARSSAGDSTGSAHQVELEVGMNDRFDFGLYQDFSQEPAGALSYEG